MQAEYGIGAYSPVEAGRLLDIPPATIRHWVFGYSYDHHGPRRNQPPLWRPQYGTAMEEPLLGFRDLLEARIVRGLRRQNFPMQTIRRCLEVARELVNDEHPFSTRRFKTDGKTLFVEQGDGVLDLKQRQHVFRSVIAPTLTDLDFDLDAASRWWLNPKRRTLVIDPERAFGQPIVAESGVTTASLAQAVEAEGSVEKVASWFDLSPAVVQDALRFERRTLH